MKTQTVIPQGQSNVLLLKRYSWDMKAATDRVTTCPGNWEKSRNKTNASYGLEKSVNGGQRSGKTLMSWEKCQI